MSGAQCSSVLHQDTFKSYVSSVKTLDDLLECMEPALSYQFLFERKTSPWEMSCWNQNELQNFKVEAEKVDRVYYVKCTEDDYGSDFYLLCRMKYADKHVFVEFAAGCDYTGFDCQGGGDIYITFDPSNFYNEALQNLHDDDGRNLLLHALQEDGCHVDLHQQSRLERTEAWNSPLPGKTCHDTVRDSQDSLGCFPDQLPNSLTDSVSVSAITRNTLKLCISA